MSKGQVTERSFYPSLKGVISDFEGKSVQEVRFNSYPDIIFQLDSYEWILSVKIGETRGTLKDAFIQYMRHKEESGIPYGILLFLPESARNIPVDEDAIKNFVLERKVTALVDAGNIKEHISDQTFRGIISFIRQSIPDQIKRGKRSYYSLPFVISLLQEQVSEMMQQISISENSLLQIITDRALLMNLGELKRTQVEDVARFLASYILMSQILFLRLLISAKNDFFNFSLLPITSYKLRQAFKRVLDINYRPIYAINVLDSIPEKFILDTFDLIWGLELERAQHDLPGRIFHELMPPEIRKMLAAFYTRPHSASLLANLCLSRSYESVFDPACGSGTILVSAYLRKLKLFKEEGLAGNPHKRFCEEEIFGADIMPFAVHLTSANLASMDAATPIERTQIIQGDSLDLILGEFVYTALQLRMFREQPTAERVNGELYKVKLDKVDAILMNPPFTKVERGIRNFVDMDRLKDRCGGEVGLWGHFIVLADEFLKDGGIFGAVIPINVLRGRESKNVREILFNEWTPLYILKPTRNFGFSEGASYRDVLFVARKQKPSLNHQVRFCLIKKDLTELTEEDSYSFAEKIKENNRLRSEDIDVDSYKLSEIQSRFTNMMWFFGVTDYKHRDPIVKFFDKFSSKLQNFPDGSFREGYRPVPRGVSKFLFLTRHLTDSRVQQAFLEFSNDERDFVKAESPLGASYRIALTNLTRSIRTPVGLSMMDITEDCDYIIHQEHNELDRILSATGFEPPKQFSWTEFWNNLQSELVETETNLLVSNRINPFSPSTHLVSFFSEEKISPSNLMSVVVEDNKHRAKAVSVILNSILFFSQFFLLKEESTGTYLHIRFYDLYEMYLYPYENQIDSLVKVFDLYSKKEFPCLYKQFDIHFLERYDEFWNQENVSQQRLWNIFDKPVKPSPVRLEYDLAVCQALDVPISTDELIELYEVFVNEMIMIRGLSRG